MKIGASKKVDRPAAREIAAVRFRALGEVIAWKNNKKSIFENGFPIKIWFSNNFWQSNILRKILKIYLIRRNIYEKSRDSI